MHVKLLCPHTHAGRRYPAGAVLSTLRSAQAEWLVAVGVAEAVAPTHVDPAKAGKKE
jgi:hypothetical protein